MKKISDSIFPPLAGIDDVAAIQALERGDADSRQQKMALNYIVNVVANVYNMSYRRGEDGRRDTDFLEGRRSVGLNLISMTKINLKMMKEKK